MLEDWNYVCKGDKFVLNTQPNKSQLNSIIISCHNSYDYLFHPFCYSLVVFFFVCAAIPVSKKLSYLHPEHPL